MLLPLTALRAGGAYKHEEHIAWLHVGFSAGWDATKKSPSLLLVTHGTVHQIAADFRETNDLAGFFTVNVSDIIRRLRRRAREAGIDLERPFFFAPDDPRFDQILRQVGRERDPRVARLRKDKTKLAKTKKRVHREDIASLPALRRSTIR